MATIITRGAKGQPLTTADMDGNLTNLNTELVNTTATADAALPRSGGTMTGTLTLSGAPTANLHAATKAYVDSAVSGGGGGSFVPLSGGTMTGSLTLSGAPTLDLHAATKLYVDGVGTVAGAALARSGGTMTGALTLSGAPTAALHAATKGYVDTTTVLLTGGTMTGALTLPNSDPTVANHATRKSYVDAVSKDTAQIQASEALAAGDFVNVHNVGGQARVRKASAASAGLEAHGFVLVAVANAAQALVHFDGNNNATGAVTPGVAFLSTTPGKSQATAPTLAGQVVQRVGYAVNGTTVNFDGDIPLVL